MLRRLAPQAPDKIIGLMQAFQADPRPDKIDLGVGVYRDAAGQTPIMRGVKAAEERLWRTQQSKGYIAIDGDPAFLEAITALVLGPDADRDRVAAIATPGGTGAVRLALDLVGLARRDARIFIPDPSWPNHGAITEFLGFQQVAYRYYDAAAKTLGRAAMLADLERAGPGDVVILHGCCHNPTGADLSTEDWAEIAAILGRTGALPLVDLAYQGFGAGLEADVAGLRMLADALPELLITVSGSKNFGLYRERVGALLAIAPEQTTRENARTNLSNLNRQTYAFPPDHGARVVTEILGDAELRTDWQRELEAMRLRMQGLRGTLSDTLRDASRSDRFSFIAAQRGLFSLIGASPAQVAALRDEHGIYVIGDGRMNVAGLSETTIPRIAQAMLSVGL